MTTQDCKILSNETQEITTIGKLLSQLTPEEREKVEFGIRFGKMVFKHDPNKTTVQDN